MLCKNCAGLLRGSLSATANVTLLETWRNPKLYDVFIRQATTWKRRIVKQQQIENDVIQYAPDKLRRVNRIYVWGVAMTGALGVRRFLKPRKGQQARSKQLTPHILMFFRDNNIDVKHVGCGYGFSVFAGTDHDSKPVLYGCGINTDSQLGYQEYPRKSGRILDYVVEPARLDLPLDSADKLRIVDVACGRAHTLIATDSKGVYSLGNNAHGQCGRPVVPEEQYRGSQVINKVSIEEDIKKVFCGQDHSLFLTGNGEVFSCGLGADGQTGLGHYNAEHIPTKIKGDIDGEKIVAISSRSDTVLAVSDKGDLFGWGNSEYDQLSSVSGDETQVFLPRHLNLKGIGKVKDVAVTGSMCALLNENGEVYVWGFGILGKGPKLEDCQIPEKIPETLFGRNDFNPDQKVLSLGAGFNHFAAITESGELYMWGKNKSACLGLGHIKDQYFPYKVQVPADVERISCGVDHTIVQCKTFV